MTRDYRGASRDGTPRVWIVHRVTDPPVEEIAAFTAELRAFVTDTDLDAPGRRERRQALLARKQDLLDRIEAARAVPEPTALEHRPLHSPDGFGWADSGSGAADLARAILATELGEGPAEAVYLKFRDDVIARLPRGSFELPAADVWAWIDANRRLVETEQFERPPTADQPSLAFARDQPVVYMGDATDGTARVWAVPPELCGHFDEVADVLATAERLPEPRPLHPHPFRSATPFPWSRSASHTPELAVAILDDQLVEPLPLAVYEKFHEDVIAGLPPTEFVIPADRVQGWILANRQFVAAQLRDPTPTADPPSLAVVSDPPGNGAGPRPGPTASSVVGAIESAWSAIQANHPEVPDAVIVLGTGVERGRLVKLGHWWGGRWLADGQVRGEVLLAGEALHLKPDEVFEVLLHEAAHGLNAARGIKDSSRGGRYHNQHYQAAAHEVGLRAQSIPPYGWARTTLTPAAAERYSEQISALGESMRIARQLARGVQIGEERGTEVSTGAGPRTGSDREPDWQPRTRNGVAASCGCGRRLRMAPTVLAQGPVVCGLCGVEFTTGAQRDTGAEPDTNPTIVDTTFMERRHRALAFEPATDAPTIREGTLRHWREAWNTERELLLVGRSPAEVEALNALARAALKETGALHGPAAQGGGLELMAGDRIVVGPDGLAWPGNGEPVEEGIPGVVEAVADDGSWVEIDFAIEGQTKFPIDTLGPLTYGYAVDENDIAADLDLHPVGLCALADTGVEPDLGPEVELP